MSFRTDQREGEKSPKYDPCSEEIPACRQTGLPPVEVTIKTRPMKTKIFKTLTLVFLTLAFSFTTQAQFPNFTRVDTGSIYVSQGSLAHASGVLFDIDNDGDLDPVLSSMNACGSSESPLAVIQE